VRLEIAIVGTAVSLVFTLGACRPTVLSAADPNCPTNVPAEAGAISHAESAQPQTLEPKNMKSKTMVSEQIGTPTVPESQRLCPTDDMEECLAFAIRVLAGDENNPPDRTFAKRLAREACDRDYARACNRLGTWLETESRGSPDPRTEAFNVYLKGCDLGDMLPCYHAGVLLSRPHHYHLSEDWPRAFQLLTMACNGGNCSACDELAVLFREGRGCARDAKRARVYQKLSHDLGCVE
jgi:hypothetical protein